MVLAELYGIKLFTDFFFNRFIDTVISIASSNLLVNLILTVTLRHFPTPYPTSWPFYGQT